MKRIIIAAILIAAFTLSGCAGFTPGLEDTAARHTIPNKVTGSTLDASEFQQIPDALDALGGTWWIGTDTPPSSSVGEDTDFYYNTSTKVLYQKTSGTWASVDTLAGADSTLTELTGGGANALDAISDADLQDGDSRTVSRLNGETVLRHFLIFDADGTDAEFSPYVIRPDDYNVGVWRLTRLGLHYVINHTTPAASSTETFRPGIATVTVANAFNWAFANWSANSTFDSLHVGITNGGALITWPPEVDWPGGIAPSLTPTGIDWLQFWTIDGGTTVHGNVISYDSK